MKKLIFLIFSLSIFLSGQAESQGNRCQSLFSVIATTPTLEVQWTPYSKNVKTPTVLADKVIIHILKDESFRLYLLKLIKKNQSPITDFKQIADATPLYDVKSGPTYPQKLNPVDHDGSHFTHAQLIAYVLKNYRLGHQIKPDVARFSEGDQEARKINHPLQAALIRQGLMRSTDNSNLANHLIADALHKLHESWEVLLRKTTKETDDTKLFMPNAYVVAGGRFRESYFWDSFWIMKGLIESGYGRTALGMLENYVYLFEKYGIIPNGNRFYYLTRTQFPVFLEMVALLDQHKLLNFSKTQKSPSLEKRILNVSDLYYTNIWRGTDRYVSSHGLFRYSDGAGGSHDPHKVVIRPETGIGEARPHENHAKRVYAESGWDFSYTRFAQEPQNYLPVDLNFMLMGYTEKLSALLEKAGQTDRALVYKNESQRINQKLNEHLKDDRTGLYVDYKFAGEQTGLSTTITAASFFPFYFSVYKDQARAKIILRNLLSHLKPKGHLAIHTTDKEGTGQWDGSWSWAPLNEIAFQSLLNYGLVTEAKRLAYDYSLMVLVSYYKNGQKYFEKYQAKDGSIKLPEDTEIYGNEDGFGWTNGTTAVFLRHLSEWGLLPQLEVDLANAIRKP